MRRKNTAVIIAFAAYAALMVWLLFLQRAASSRPPMSYGDAVRFSTNFRPLHTIREQLWILKRSSNPFLVRFAIVNLAGNVAAFIPAGYFLPALWPVQRRFFIFLITMALIIALIEAVQLFTLLGSCDIDDLILNLPGALLGWTVYMLSHRCQKE